MYIFQCGEHDWSKSKGCGGFWDAAVAAPLMWRSGTAGNTTPLHMVPLKRYAERHLGAEERGERRESNEKEREKRGERKKIFFK